MSTQTQAAPVRQLLASDRCDRCGAPAIIRVRIHGSDLHFCAHDGKIHKQRLLDQGGVVVIDDSDTLRPPV